jgi:5-methylcytosine-specific restriction protein A
MDGRTLNRLLNLNASHALYREDGGWYHHLEEFPGVLFDKNGYVLFNEKSDYVNHPHLIHDQDLHTRSGISSMQEYVMFTNEQRRNILFETKEIDEESLRVLRQVNIVVRNYALVRKLKKEYNDTCQICNLRLRIGKDAFYSEVHHVKPLGNPHNGFDRTTNMICVCPNCHVQLDLGAIPINIQDLKLLKHVVSEEYVEYHNNSIYKI